MASSGDNVKPGSDSHSPIGAIKWGAIAVLAVLAIYGIQGKTSAEGQLSTLKSEADALRKQVDNALGQRKTSQEEIARLKTAEADALRQVEEGKADVSTAMAKVTELEAKTQGQDKEIQDLKSKLAATEDQQAKSGRALDDANRGKAELEKARADAENARAAAEKAKADAEAAVVLLQKQIETLNTELQTARKDAEAAKAAAAQPSDSKSPAPATPASP
jgi:colicin import membrane protein